MKREERAVACDLGALDSAQRVRHRTAVEMLESARIGVEEASLGVVLRYPARPELVAAAGEWLGLERLCCPFLRFELSVDPGAETFSLSLGGSEEAKAFLFENVVRGGR